jgi:hypothetical protein
MAGLGKRKPRFEPRRILAPEALPYCQPRASPQEINYSDNEGLKARINSESRFQRWFSWDPRSWGDAQG